MNTGKGKGRRNSVYRPRRSWKSRKKVGWSVVKRERRVRRRRRRCKEEEGPWVDGPVLEEGG